MLQLKNINKQYHTGETTVQALSDVSLEFRDSEFVALLGPSGCGKTTLLNIIGGLDRYTDGDVVIDGVSTTAYRDADWDAYRNNSIGFVFQNYNLIPHQTVLANVELAMTLAGVSASERRQRATEALEQVGLGDQLNKKPTQMSGGQMQRVAIARALVNNPRIILADEPTGALDSETSVQVMDLLKEVARDRLVIMVTHNRELAEEYATRIVRLRDGRTISDSRPYHAAEAGSDEEDSDGVIPVAAAPLKKVSMSFGTALGLSLNNLMTKKGRTFLTAFAGSIGIIGIALILSISSGMQAFISNMEEDTLSTYPLVINNQSIDMTALAQEMSAEIEGEVSAIAGQDPNRLYTHPIAGTMIRTLMAQESDNDLAHFKQYLESDAGQGIRDQTNTIEYGYDLTLQVFNSDAVGGQTIQVNPSDVMGDQSQAEATSGGLGQTIMDNSMMSVMGSEVWTQLIGNQELLDKQYDVVAGAWPSASDEIVLVADANNQIVDMALYSLGLLNPAVLEEIQKLMLTGSDLSSDQLNALIASGDQSFSFDDILNTDFKLVLNTAYYSQVNGVWTDQRDDPAFMAQVLADALDLRVAGIVRPAEDVTATAITGTVGYTAALTEYVVNAINTSAIAQQQVAQPDIDVFTGLPFNITDHALTAADIQAYVATLPAAQQAQFQTLAQTMSEADLVALVTRQIQAQSGSDASYAANLEKLGVVDLDTPSSVRIYPKDYAAKEVVQQAIADYNTTQTNDGHDEFVVHYTDIMGLMMSSITDVIDLITYVLVGFVSISLIVSSIMIGIITYISVLERTKEIGILRSIGASKRDISRVFTAETVIEGFAAGVIGILVTILLNIPINLIIDHLSGVSGIASLPWQAGIGLVAISMVLTIVAGLLPSRIAANKDPVEALRTE
ncbi:MAG: ABC transporter ATP-binding protein/permease [Propionibacteriaceae bacterium]|nr:ABC transporter ATP-binding protein/permease [Propionibacteriaceae bacterium]